MPISLSKAERKLLEKTTTDARNLAESACRAALENLAVHEKDYRAHMSTEQRHLRNRLRARGRALGDKRDERSGTQGIYHLTELCAYEHWHRLLFTRFLTENHLLITDETNGSVPITLEECEELAPELGARDGFDLACRFASRTLPGVFRRDDPVLDLPIALNDQVELRRLLASLPPDCFRADDALGWTYQFWQAQRKEEVNKSGKKISADELAPVTQLFTEDYMVEFLLHNTLGAWWAGKLGPIPAASEEEARALASLPARDGVPAMVWSYLRFVQDEATKTWLPAAGTFAGWPKAASLIRLLDPCMGSGHFLVFALPLLISLRMEEEALDPKAAVVAVVADNIYGLELDERCTQIAAFNVALTAWKLVGYQRLPPLQLACSGLGPSATEADWVALAGDDDRLRRGMMRLYNLFKEAPTLGSLIDPHSTSGNLIEAEFHELAPLLTAALSPGNKLMQSLESDATELGVIARGLAKAADLLTGKFTLVITNVPYLGRGKQDDVLRRYCERVHNSARADLATCFVERCIDFSGPAGIIAVVTPQSWLFQGTSTALRRSLLTTVEWCFLIQLGAGAFETVTGQRVSVAMLIISNRPPGPSQVFLGIDLDGAQRSPTEKAESIRYDIASIMKQIEQLDNPDSRITKRSTDHTLINSQASCVAGMLTGDSGHFIARFWESNEIAPSWEFLQSTVTKNQLFGGRTDIVLWESGKGQLYKYAQRVKHLNTAVQRWRTGQEVWGKRGVVVSCMGALPCTLYLGDRFDNNVGVIAPLDERELPAFWAYCTSEEFVKNVRSIDRKMNVTPATFGKVQFDLSHWRQIAAEKYPDGLQSPNSSDPTQWLFNGHPKGAVQSLHVAVARLLGYRWPRQTGSTFPDCPALLPDGLESFAADDGIVCLPPLNREQPAAARLRQLLTAALGAFDERELVAKAGLKGSKSNTLEEWLRDEFFEQHAKLFLDKPFIWHLWDGRLDGFHVLVNYHLLNHATLQKLTYSYLGNWIQQQAEDSKMDKPGAASRLGAARELQIKLAAILKGEAPLDIFVRWKRLSEQAQGWHPDLDDGMRQNIRPIILSGDVAKHGAGLFRAVPLTLKDKDRGIEPELPKTDYPWFWCEDEPGTDPVGGTEFVGTRWNNVHLTLEKKRKSRA